MFSKEDQLKKTKQPNPKKMTPLESTNLHNFIFAEQGGKCFCGCGRDIDEYHHVFFGINKDDRYKVGIAQHPCHYAIHHGKDIDEKRRLIALSEDMGKAHYRRYTSW